MLQRISNSKFYLFLLILFKCFGLILFVYPYHKFKYSKVRMILTFAYFFHNFWILYRRFFPIHDYLSGLSKVMRGLLYFHMATEAFTKFISLCLTIRSQRIIFQYLKSIEEFNIKISRFGQRNNHKSSNLNFYQILLLFFILDSFIIIYIYNGLIEGIIHVLFYIPTHFYVFIVLIAIQCIERLESILR